MRVTLQGGLVSLEEGTSVFVVSPAWPSFPDARCSPVSTAAVFVWAPDHITELRHAAPSLAVLNVAPC